MAGSVDLNNTALLLVAATVFVHEGNFEAALRVLHPSDELECSALKVSNFVNNFCLHSLS